MPPQGSKGAANIDDAQAPHGFQQVVGGRRSAKEVPMGYCPYGDCMGKCPQARIDKGLRRGGDPAYCLLCRRAGRTTKFERAPGSGSDSAAIKELKAKNALLERKCAELAKAGPADTKVLAQNEVSTEEQKVVLDKLQEECKILKGLQDIAECCRPAMGNYAELVDGCKERVRVLRERQRNLKPPDIQLQQSLNHLKEVKERHAKGVAAVEASEKALLELQAKLTEQKSKSAASLLLVQSAETEVAAKKAAVGEVHSEEESAPKEQSRGDVQLSALKNILIDKVQPTLSAELSSALVQICTALDLVSCGSVVAASCASASDAGDMELDEDDLDFLAEHAVGPVQEGEDESARTQNVSKAKAALRAKRTDVGKRLVSLAKVRKR